MAIRKIKINKDGGVDIHHDDVQHFDTGGPVATPQAQPQMAAQPTTQQSGGPGNSFSNITSKDPTGFYSGLGTAAGTATNDVGSFVKGIGSAFTTQNGYEANLAPTTNYDYSTAIGSGQENAAQGYGEFNETLGNQNDLITALKGQAAGNGPSPAQTQLAQNTAANTANTAAQMAGARGASGNVGLMARQIGQQGAANQQNAVGQAASLKAQEQLAAEGQLGNVIGQQQSGITGEQNANTGLFSAGAAANNSQNNTSVANYGMAQGINAQVAQNNANAANSSTKGLLTGGGALASLSKGGEVGKDGFYKSNKKLDKVPKKDRMPMPSHLKMMADLYHPQKFDGGGPVLAQQPSAPTVSTPNISGSSDSADSESKSAGGGAASLAALLAKGGKVPGKPKVDHNSEKNDVVPAMLTPKEIVLPLSVTQSEDAPEAAKAFVAKLLERHGKSMSGEHSDFHKALKTAISSRKK